MPKDPFIREKFTKERTAARTFAQEYFERYPKDRYQTEVESWRLGLGRPSLSAPLSCGMRGDPLAVSLSRRSAPGISGPEPAEADSND
jgi:hypothetical protein